MKIKSEEVLFDTDGNRIQAHGGSVIYVNGKFYLYGENKEEVYGKDEECHWPRWHSGIKLYSSNDLVSWKFEGYVKEVSKDPWNPFYPTYIMDRPHIIYNKKTNKFVCWVKSSYDIYCHTGYSILVGDSLLNMQYTGVIKPRGGHTGGDFDLFEVNGKGYIVYAQENRMALCELNDDYTDFGEKESIHLESTYPPYVREAPCFFNRNGRLMILTSGTTGYYPNQTKAYDISNLHGEWKEIGYTCVDDKFKNSFHTQFSSVFKHPTIPDLYIAIGDRWINDPGIGERQFEDIFERVYRPNHGPDWDKDVFEIGHLSKENLTKASYVWLPIKFTEKNDPYIEFKKEWDF